MRPEAYLFDLYPQIVCAGRPSHIHLRALYDRARFPAGSRFRVSVIPAAGLPDQMRHPERPAVEVTAVDGELSFTHLFEGEGEHVLLVETPDGDPLHPLAEFRLYALADDLFARPPLKGDLHIHSSRSDGLEPPAYVAAACRRIGLDFMAVTDHHRYAPSVEAQRAFARVDHDLRIYPGEEIHPPDNPVHMVNFGGSFSVNDLFSTDAYATGVAALVATLTGLPPGVDPYRYASCAWCFDRIREGGGLGIFCHPEWFSRYRYDVPEALTRLLLERQPFDALELIGGYMLSEVESNVLQVALYGELAAAGRRPPVVGVSDAHGCERGDLFGWYYSIVFAPSAGLPDLVGAIRDQYSVAVQARPGEAPRAFGPHRLVKYALYLMRELFPRHDELCREEGRLMLAHLAGDPDAASLLARLSGRTAALYRRLWSPID